jgi:hypothetical protein
MTHKKTKATKRKIAAVEEDEYEVSEIVGVRHTIVTKVEYLVRWKNCTSKDDTWEPDEHLSDSVRVWAHAYKAAHSEEKAQAETAEGDSPSAGLEEQVEENVVEDTSKTDRKEEKEAAGGEETATDETDPADESTTMVEVFVEQDDDSDPADESTTMVEVFVEQDDDSVSV